MDFHRLRVVGFDTSVREKEGEKKYIAKHEEYKQEDWKTSTDENKYETLDENQCLDGKISPPGTSKKYLDGTSIPPRTSNKCPDYKICPPGISEKYLFDTTTTSPPGTSKKDNFARSKSNSEIFKIPHKNKPRKRDLKINSSDVGLTKLFRDSAYLHQKKRTLNLRNRNSRVHHKVENVKEKNEKDEEVHFLFARETPSFIKYCRKRARNRRTTAKKERDCELSNDICDFKKSRSMDQHHYRMSCCNFIDIDKIPFKKLRRGLHRKPTPPQLVEATNCACKHHAMRLLNSACEIPKISSIYYNLETHPRICQRERDYDQEEGFGRERSHCMAKDESVEVSPSALGFVPKSCRDARTGPSKVEFSAVCPRRPPCVCEKSPALDNVTITSKCNQERNQLLCTPKPGVVQNKCKKKRNKMKKTKFITTVLPGYISRFVRHITEFHTKNRLSTGEGCIKYVFLGLLIVVWSPCLLAVILAWVVMFPAKLKRILKTDKSKRSCPMNYSIVNRFRKKDSLCEYQRMCFENYLPKNKRSFMTSATSWYSRAVGTVVKTLTSLLRLKKKVPTGAGSSFLPSSHPNPRKRYNLFYAENRGWVMKPLRRRHTRSAASTRGVQSMRCEGKPKLRYLKNLPQKFKKACPCPVHGDDIYPRHESSAAGDARPMQFKHSWPSCACWDKYSQGSSIFKRLESRRRRNQKVNIPPTFSYLTSDIAFNSDDKTINAELFNSIGIADNIAHEDLAKYHLSQRKNGTLPFGLVFNHPRGTKHPLLTNLETFRAHKFGLAGKTLNMSEKFTPSLVRKGLQGQLPKCWNKHEAGKAVKKSPGAHRITSFAEVTNSMPTKHISSYRQSTKRKEGLDCPSGRNHKSAIKNKNIHTFQKSLNFRNKCVSADIPQLTGNKQANTSTYKINYAHKIQNTPKHCLYHKVSKKTHEAEKDKPDMASKCAKHTPPKRSYKYKTDKTRVPTQKHSSPAKLKTSIKPGTVLNYSFIKKRKQSKQGYKYNPDQSPVATEKQSNKADITTNTNHNKALNYLSGEKHKPTKQANKYKPHQVRVATQKQSNKADITTNTNHNNALNCPSGEKHKPTKQANKYKPHQVRVATQKQRNKADIMTSTNVDIALSCPCGDKHKQSEQANKYRRHQVPVATQKQSNKADITTSTNVDIALNCRCGEKHKQSTQANKYKPHQVRVATQKQRNKADIMTSTNVDIALSCPCGDKHKQSEQANKYRRHQVPVATQKQSNKADITTSTNVDIAFNCPCEEKHEQYKHDYKYEPHQIPYATQMQSRTADNTTMTNHEIALNFPCEEKHEQYKHDYNYEPHQISYAIQMQSRTADNTTMTNHDIAWNSPCEEKHEQYEHCFKNEPNQIPDATQMQSRKADNTTMTNHDLAFNYFGGVKPSSAYKEILCIPSTPICTQKTNSPEYGLKKQDISIQKQASKIETSVYCPSDYKRSKTKEIVRPAQTVLPKQAYKIYKPYKTTVSIQKQQSTTDIMTRTNRDIPLNCPCEEKHEPSKQSFIHKPYKTTVPIQKHRSTANIMTSTNRDVSLNYLSGVKPSTANKEILCIPSTTDKDPICPQKTSSLEYALNKQDISIQKPASKIEASVYCASDYERSKTKVMVRPEQMEFPKRKLDCTSCCASTSCDKTGSLKQTSCLKKVTDWGWGGELGGSRKLNGPCLYKGTQTIARLITQENKGEVEAERPKKAFTKEMVDSGGGAKPMQQTLGIDCGLDIERNLNKFLRESFSTSRTILPNRTENKPAKQQPSQRPSLVGRSLEISRISTTHSLPAREPQTDELLKQFQPHANSPVFGISSDSRRYNLAPQITQVSDVHANSSQFQIAKDCRCGVSSQQNMPDKEMEQIATGSKSIYNHEISSAKEPRSQLPRLAQASSHTLQEQPKSFGITFDCPCGTNQPIVAEKSLYNKITGSKSHTAKKTQLKFLAIRPSTNGDNITPHSYQNRSVDKSLSKNAIKETLTPALKKSSITKFPKSPEPSPPHLVTSPPTQPEKDSRKTRVETEAQAEYPQNLSTQQPKVSKQSRQYSSQTPLTDRQGPTSDEVTAHPRKTHIATETPPTTSTDIQDLPCGCKCGSNSAHRVNSKSPLHLPSAQPDIYKVDKTLSKFPKSLEHLPSKVSQATTPVFAIATDCRCGVTPQQNELNQTQQIGTDSKKTNTHKICSAKAPPSQQSKLKQTLSQTLEEQPKLFGIACDCTCGTNQPIEAENSLYSKVTGSKSHTAKKTQTKYPPNLKKSSILPLPKYLPHKFRCPVETLLPKSLPRKFRCPVESLQNPAGEQPYYTKGNTTSSKRNIVKINKSRSKFPKSPDRSPFPKSKPRKCRCPVETLQDSVGKQPYGTKVSTTSSERNIIKKVDKARTKFLKSPDHSPPPKSSPRKCRCPVDTLQGPVGKLHYGTKLSATSSKRNIVKIDKTRSNFPKSPDRSPFPKAMPLKCQCPVETLQASVGKQSYGTKAGTTTSERNVIKKLDKTRTKFPKSPGHSPPPKYSPRKCQYPVETLQDSVGKQPYGTKVGTTSSERNVIKKLDKTRPKFLKSADHSPPPKSSSRKCRCPVKTLQDSVGKQHYGTKVSATSSERNVVKVDKTRSNFQKSPDHSPPQKNLLHTCQGPVKSLQDSVDKQTSQCARKSFFSRKSKLKSLDFPHECPCYSSHNYFDKRCIEPVKSVLRNSRLFSIRSYEGTEGTCSINEPSSRVQYRSKVSRLVMSLRCKLFSRKISKQTKLPENPTEKPRSVIISSLQVNPKKVDKSHTRLLQHDQQSNTLQRSSFSPYLSKTCHLCHYPYDDTENISLHTRKSMLDDELNRSFFRRSHIISKTSQNPCSCVIHQSSSRQFTNKNRYISKPLLADKSYSCIRVSKISQRPSFLSHSSKLERRSHVDNTSSLRLSKNSCYSYPKLSQRIRSQQSKTSEHSSIVISPIDCPSDETFSAPKDGMSHQILKTLFKRNLPWKSQHLTEQNRSPFSQSQETLSKKQSILTQCRSLSHTIIPGICRCAAKHLGKITSRQSNPRPEQLPNQQYFNRSQKQTSGQKQSSKKFSPQYSSSLNNYQLKSTAKQTMTSQHPLSPEPLKSKRSYLFYRCQSKPLVEKIKSITDEISSNSRKYKQDKTSSTVSAQTTLTFSSKYACWPEKLNQLSKKLSQLSRGSVEKITPSKLPPHLLSAQNPQHISIPPLHRSSQSKQLTEKVKKQFNAIPQQPKAEQVIPILSGKCKCAGEQKIKTEYSLSNKLQPNTDLQKLPSTQPSRSPNSHNLPTDTQRFASPTALHSTRKTTLGTDGQLDLSQHLPSVQPDISNIYSLHRSSQSKQLSEKVEKQFDAIPQQPQAEQVIPILSGKCRCAGKQKIKTEHSSKNKLQHVQTSHSPNSQSLRIDNQRFQFPTASHPTRKSILGTVKQPEFSQHLPNQPLETPVSKLSQPHPRQQADIPHSAPLHNSQLKRKKPCKCRSFKHGNAKEIPNSLRKIAKAQSSGMSHYYSDKFQKSPLISCVYPVTAKKNVIIQRSEISQSSENPQYQPNPQIQVYQQNLQYQKRLSPILTNLKKPLPGLLQQNSPGLGQTGTAKGGVQQPYPDFNRVRYPGYNSLDKQSEPIPGLNRPLPTNINPPAPPPPPRASPPSKYARDPCYTNPANRSSPKSPYDESALRRAYKRRPLRYTPTRQQLPRVVVETKLREKKKKAAAAKKRKAKRSRKKTCFRCLRDLINQTEREVWPTDVTCHPMWLNALKQKPCFWIYKMCPRTYPAFLNFYKLLKLFVYLLTLCFWSPLLLCAYFCFNIICKG